MLKDFPRGEFVHIGEGGSRAAVPYLGALSGLAVIANATSEPLAYLSEHSDMAKAIAQWDEHFKQARAKVGREW